jgi:hypothetical protein
VDSNQSIDVASFTTGILSGARKGLFQKKKGKEKKKEEE